MRHLLQGLGYAREYLIIDAQVLIVKASKNLPKRAGDVSCKPSICPDEPRYEKNSESVCHSPGIRQMVIASHAVARLKASAQRCEGEVDLFCGEINQTSAAPAPMFDRITRIASIRLVWVKRAQRPGF